MRGSLSEAVILRPPGDDAVAPDVRGLRGLRVGRGRQEGPGDLLHPGPFLAGHRRPAVHGVGQAQFERGCLRRPGAPGRDRGRLPVTADADLDGQRDAAGPAGRGRAGVSGDDVRGITERPAARAERADGDALARGQSVGPGSWHVRAFRHLTPWYQGCTVQVCTTHVQRGEETMKAIVTAARSAAIAIGVAACGPAPARTAAAQQPLPALSTNPVSTYTAPAPVPSPDGTYSGSC